MQLVLVTSECAKSGTFFFLGGDAKTPNKDLTRTEKLVSERAVFVCMYSIHCFTSCMQFIALSHSAPSHLNWSAYFSICLSDLICTQLFSVVTRSRPQASL